MLRYVHILCSIVSDISKTHTSIFFNISNVYIYSFCPYVYRKTLEENWKMPTKKVANSLCDLKTSA